jgi:hypothetical protein
MLQATLLLPSHVAHNNTSGDVRKAQHLGRLLATDLKSVIIQTAQSGTLTIDIS